MCAQDGILVFFQVLMYDVHLLSIICNEVTRGNSSGFTTSWKSIKGQQGDSRHTSSKANVHQDEHKATGNQRDTTLKRHFPKDFLTERGPTGQVLYS